MTDQEKIRELKQYRWLLKEERQLRDELHTLRLQAVPGAIRYDGSGVHADAGDRLADWAARIEATERKLTAAIAKAADERRRIETSIGRIRETRERVVLRMIYIDGHTQEQTAEMLDQSPRWIAELHRRGVRHYRSKRQ